MAKPQPWDDAPGRAPEIKQQATSISKRWLAGLFLAALIVRLISLGRADLWCDEILFVNLAMPPQTPWDIAYAHWQKFLVVGHVPLPAMIQNIVLWMFRPFVDDLLHQPWIQRLPAAVWGGLAVPAFFLLALRLIPRPAAIGAVLMMTFFVFPVYYAREAYVYAPLLFFAVVALYEFVSLIRNTGPDRQRMVILGLASVGLVLSHLTGSILVLAMLISAIGLWALERRAVVKGINQAACVRIAGIGLFVLVLVIPFYGQFMMNPSPHHFIVKPKFMDMINDVMGKVFFGVHEYALIPAWGVFLAGLITWIRKDSTWFERQLVLVVSVIGLGAVLLSSWKTQYAVRYFTCFVPVLYMMAAFGIYGLLARFKTAPTVLTGRLALGIYGILAAIQVCVYLPLVYGLPAKSVNFGDISRWLNAQLSPGTPYLMESGYELRFVSGYFPTPKLVAACPYVHGAGVEEMRRLRQVQMNFLLQFPETCFVESARHGWNDPRSEIGLWDWPHRYFRRRVDIRNTQLQSLIRLGICPLEFDEKSAEVLYSTPIWYNTPADVEAMARDAGVPVLATYEGWDCTPVGQGIYMRVKAGTWGSVNVKSLRGAPVRGRFVMEAAIAGQEGSVKVAVKWAGKPVVECAKWSGSLWSLETPEVTVLPGEHPFEWGSSQSNRTVIRGVLMMGLRFVETKNDSALSSQPAL